MKNLIEVYDYNNLTKLTAKLTVLSGSYTHSINAAYKLQARFCPKSLPKGFKLTPFTVFKVGNIFYRQKVFSASDAETGVVNIDAADLLYADLLDLDAGEFVMSGAASEMLTALLQGTKFTAGICDDLGVREIDVKNANKQTVLNKILEIFNGELDRELLTVSIRERLIHSVNGAPFELIKGKNVVSIEESIDTTPVITSLRFCDSTEELEEGQPPTYDVIYSAYADNYPPKQGFKEFKGNAYEQAWLYLEANELPRSYRVVKVPFNFKQGFKLGTVTRLFCEQINIDLTERVIELTHDLTGQEGDTYVLGQKQRSFQDILMEVTPEENFYEEQFEELREEFKVELKDEMKDEVKSDLELIIPEIIDERFEEVVFEDIKEMLEDPILIDKLAELTAEKLPGIDAENIKVRIIEVLTEMEGIGGHIILDSNGNAMPQQPKLQFTGNVMMQDDPEGNVTKVTPLAKSWKHLHIADAYFTVTWENGEQDNYLLEFYEDGRVAKIIALEREWTISYER